MERRGGVQAMRPRDRDLGMDRPITRRDFLQGVGVATAAAMTPSRALADAVASLEAPQRMPASYPPALTGLRGDHVGSFEVAHELAFSGRRDWGAVHEPDEGIYDLVVVGGGVSGLSAAHFFRAQEPAAKVLILENHDDFGGHAKRNEFRSGGSTLIGYGGTQSFENPSQYSGVTQELLRELGIEFERFYSAYDRDFYASRGLGWGVYFDRDRYGVDRVVRMRLLEESGYLPAAPSPLSREEAVAQMPISENARRELLQLFSLRGDRLPDHSIFREPVYLKKISYRDLLTKHLEVREPEVLALYQDVFSGYFGVGIDATPAYSCLMYGLPGLKGTSLGRVDGLLRWWQQRSRDPYIFHFPDGLASVARLLVRRLIPAAAPGSNMEDIVTAPFDYARLDTAGASVRLRLGSTVVRVQHDGDPSTASGVRVTYVRNDRATRVRARRCVMACYNAVIPHLCPELPAEQREALASLVRVPLVYSNVQLRNWRAWQALGIAGVHCPGRYHHHAMLDFPVSLGSYRFAQGPDDPIVVHMSAALTRPNRGLSAREQHRAARYALLEKTFESFEREIRTHLAGLLGAGGFDPARDIQAITVNRWPHGYSYDYNTLFDPDYADDEFPHVRGRKRFGRIGIANSDAGGLAYIDCAIDQAHRAVEDLLA